MLSDEGRTGGESESSAAVACPAVRANQHAILESLRDRADSGGSSEPLPTIGPLPTRGGCFSFVFASRS